MHVVKTTLLNRYSGEASNASVTRIPAFSALSFAFEILTQAKI
jgi:hypothetical protein